MTDCCIPQQNPALYLFTHRVIHNHQRYFSISPTLIGGKIVIAIELKKFASVAQTFSLQCGRKIRMPR
ncbi:hypothetical protein A4C50_26160 [Escherichia coli O157:H7]|uniref:Uncharacterized protein n=1 Tax=Escherichia coli O157:H7 TaxID=83334 RepID=A0AAN1AC75_ECO57|nr:hypothetical protein AO055_25060 [Escherichia coli O157:H7]AMW43837.1 hypothetical protein ARC77_17125 [Escherichia coli]AMG80664.1 hypothetical protein JEONG1266_22535 [Escherichia coli O157:H7]AMW49256.1 hypothetical protein AR439_15985 [Escherichia coli]ANW42982.1 hypothetical protein A9L45_27505 [Escherichia coli O157:H7]